MALFDNISTSSKGETTQAQAVTPADKPLSPKAEKKSAKRAERKQAIETILTYIADEKNKVPTDVVAAAKKFKPSFFGISTGGGFAKKEHPIHVENLFKLLGVSSFDAIKVGASFDELKAFQTLHFGRGEMHKICVNLIKKPDDKGTIYLAFDADKGVYTVKGIGTEPEGWTGYRPAVAEADAE